MMRKNRTVAYFEGKISQLLSRNNDINNINELAIQAMRNQNQSDLNEFYLDVALAKLQVEKRISFKKGQQNQFTDHQTDGPGDHRSDDKRYPQGVGMI